MTASELVQKNYTDNEDFCFSTYRFASLSEAIDSVLNAFPILVNQTFIFSNQPYY